MSALAMQLEDAISTCEADLDAALEARRMEDVARLCQQRNELLAKAIGLLSQESSGASFIQRALARNEQLVDRMTRMRSEAMASLNSMSRANLASKAYDA